MVFYRGLKGLSVLLLLALGCSAEAAPEPAPTLGTPGAFVAVASDAGNLELLRTLTSLGQGDANEVLFFIRYAARPETFEVARELSKSHELAVASELTLIGERYFDDRAFQIVWFRSLTEAEQSY